MKTNTRKEGAVAPRSWNMHSHCTGMGMRPNQASTKTKNKRKNLKGPGPTDKNEKERQTTKEANVCPTMFFDDIRLREMFDDHRISIPILFICRIRSKTHTHQPHKESAIHATVLKIQIMRVRPGTVQHATKRCRADQTELYRNPRAAASAGKKNQHVNINARSQQCVCRGGHCPGSASWARQTQPVILRITNVNCAAKTTKKTRTPMKRPDETQASRTSKVKDMTCTGAPNPT